MSIILHNIFICPTLIRLIDLTYICIVKSKPRVGVTISFEKAMHKVGLVTGAIICPLASAFLHPDQSQLISQLLELTMIPQLNESYAMLSIL